VRLGIESTGSRVLRISAMEGLCENEEDGILERD
jgi:hypothetical protein